MKAKKDLVVCLTVCLVVSFVSAVYAASPLEPRGSAPVTVVNPVSKPIPVTEVKQYPVQEDVSVQFMEHWYISKIETLYIVPPGKRLVIEYLSCSSNGSYSTSYSCFIIVSGMTSGVTHYLPTTPYGHYKIVDELDPTKTNPPAYMQAGQRMQIYAEPGNHVQAGARRQNQAIMDAYDYPEEYMIFSFSGYLVDAALPVDIGPQ